MIKPVTVFLLLSVLIISGCDNNGKKKTDLVREAYDKYHPTYGYRNELPDKNLEITDDGESLWQRPPERVTVYKTPDGPETGSFRRAPVNQNYLGYKEGDDVLLEREMWNKTSNLTTRDPVKEMPDYLQGNYGSKGN